MLYKIKSSLLALLTISILIVSSNVLANETIYPEEGSAHEMVLASLKLLEEKKFDEVIKQHCAPSSCTEENIPGLKKYTLKSWSRIAKDFIKEDGKAIVVSRTEGNLNQDGKLTLFLVWKEGAMPKAIHLIRIDEKWYWERF